MAQYTNYILVCGGTGCRASQSEQIIENLRAAVEQYGLEAVSYTHLTLPTNREV